MKKLMTCSAFRHIALALVLALLVQLVPAGAFASPDKTEQKQANAKAEKKQPDVQVLSNKEMRSAYGRGDYRNRYFCGTMPWHRSFRDVNVCNGNLFKSFTDIQVKPARGAGLVLQRTYNSNDDRIGPFGRGWTHAYELRFEEAYESRPILINLDKVEKTDFFGGKHRFTRDADGLYTPPAYLHCTLESDYLNTLENGPANVNSDTEGSLDGTIKHYSRDGKDRVCDSIQDRNGNITDLHHGKLVIINGVLRGLLSEVKDPSKTTRSLHFEWSNLGTAENPAWRITKVTGPMYEVIYEYYLSPSETGAGGEAFNLKAVHLDPTGLNRTTAYTYTTFGAPGAACEYGLLASVTTIGDDVDSNNNQRQVVSYTYGQLPISPILPGGYLVGSMWVLQISEPGHVDASEVMHPRVWTIGSPMGGDWYSGLSATYDEVVYIHDNTTPPPNHEANLGFFVFMLNEPMCRFYQYASSNYDEGHCYYKWYDNNSNVIVDAQGPNNWDAGEYSNPAMSYVTQADYGPHGHVLHRWQTGFSGMDTYDYYGEAKYFQKHTVTDIANHITEFDYGSKDDPDQGDRGNMLWAKDARFGITGEKFEYAYNTYGQRISETNLNNITTEYHYDDVWDDWGNLTRIVQDVGTGHLNRTTLMKYDVAGNVTERTAPDGSRTVIEYNVLGQPETVTFKRPDDSTEETIGYGYDAYGRTVSVDDGSRTTTIDYARGWGLVESVTDSITGAISYTYNEWGGVETKTLPGGETLTYAYSELESMPKDDPNSVTHNVASITDEHNRKVEYGIDWYGALRYVQVYPDTTIEHQHRYYKTEYHYDEGGQPPFVCGGYGTHRWLTSIETKYEDGDPPWDPPVTKRKNVYTYYPEGNRDTNSVYDEAGLVRTEDYGYDELYRLTDVDYGQPSQTQHYTFDPMGNRLTKTDTVSGNESYSYNAANMIESRGSVNYQSDVRGSITDEIVGGVTVRHNVWDLQNRLRQCTNNGVTSTFTYGADGLRRSMTVGANPTVHYALDGQSVAQEGHLDNGDFVADTTYLNGARGPECKIDASGNTVWYIFDGLGSVVAEADDSGTVSNARAYDVYGIPRGGSSSTKHGFVGNLGHMTESDTGGLIYMQARWMDPLTGRFISEDPAQNGNNWYVYCGNNPVNNVDPDGKWLLQFAIGAIAVATILTIACLLYEAYIEAKFTLELAEYYREQYPNDTAKVFLYLGEAGCFEGFVGDIAEAYFNLFGQM